jgi:hypothetical protein
MASMLALSAVDRAMQIHTRVTSLLDIQFNYKDFYLTILNHLAPKKIPVFPQSFMILWKISTAISIKHRILATFNIKKNSILTACMPLTEPVEKEQLNLPILSVSDEGYSKKMWGREKAWCKYEVNHANTYKSYLPFRHSIQL